MVTATWNGAVLAESEDTVMVEGNHYFPAESVQAEHLSASRTHSTCPWKGEAAYFNVVVDGRTNKNAAFTYPNPTEAAASIAGYVAFWHGVKVRADGADSPSLMDRLMGRT